MSAQSASKQATIGILAGLFRLSGASLTRLVKPLSAAVASSVFEGLSLVLLIPTLKGIIERNFDFTQGNRYLRKYLSFFPEPWVDTTWRIAAVCIVSAVFFAALKIVTQYISQLWMSFEIATFEVKLSQNVFNRYLSFGSLFFESHSAGYLHQVLVTYVRTVAQGLRTFNTLLISFSMVLVYGVILVGISAPLTLCIIVLLPILKRTVGTLVTRVRERSKSHTKIYNDLGKRVSNVLNGMPLIKISCNEEKEKERYQQLCQDVLEARKSVFRNNLLIGPLQEVIMLFFLLFLVAIIAFLLRASTGEVAGYVVFLLTLRRLNSTIRGFGNSFGEIASLYGPATEILEVFSDDNKYFVPSGDTHFEGVKTEIAVKGLTFVYPGNIVGLDGVNFEIKQGELTAIVGQTGSGKSTMIGVLTKFYDCPGGSVLIDGVDLRDYSTSSWRQRIGLVSQDTFLFNDTLRNNIGYGAKDLSDSDIIAIADRAQLSQLIERLSEGLDTEIGDRGVRLSGGEKQRVAIARAMARDFDILILDEATSALDSKTEKVVQAALDELSAGKTTIVIAHRLSTIKKADQIILLEKGKVIEKGSINSLIKQKGVFYEYWMAQTVL